MPRGPGKSDREGISLLELSDMFPDEASAERWWIASRWPSGVACPECGSLNVQTRRTRKPQPYRCRDCRKDFSARTGSLLEGSNVSFRKWVFAIYIATVGIKGTASMRLHRDLKVSQKTAWFMMHRIRETWAAATGVPFTGAVEADETYLGGLEKNKPKWKRHGIRGAHGKMIIAGVKDRGTKQVRVRVVDRTDMATLDPFVRKHARGAPIYTDENKAYQRLPNHESVKHGVGQYVNGQAHCNGMESFWSMVKRGYHGTYHKMSPKHLPRYVAEFEGRHNSRLLDTVVLMRQMVRLMDGLRLTYDVLTRPVPGRSNYSRSRIAQ